MSENNENEQQKVWKKIKIGLFSEKGELIGWKQDTFWTIGKNGYKEHILDEEGKIPEHIIRNLEHTVKEKPQRYFSQAADLWGTIANFQKDRFFSNFETMLVGYEPLDEPLHVQGEPIFTHRLFSDGIESLDEEDMRMFSERS